MEKEPKVVDMYSEEERQLHRTGARLILMELLDTVKSDWNGAGTKLWAEQQLKEMEVEDDSGF